MFDWLANSSFEAAVKLDIIGNVCTQLDKIFHFAVTISEITISYENFLSITIENMRAGC